MEVFGVTSVLWTIVKTVLILWFISEIYDWLKILAWRRKFKLTGPFPLPLMGTIPAFILYGMKLKKMEQKLMARANSAETRTTDDQPTDGTDVAFPPCLAVCFGSLKMLMITDIELAKKIFIKDHVYFQNTFTIEGLNPHPLDKMLISLKDSDWKRVRTVLSPTFSSSKLRKMNTEINYCASCLVNGLLDKARHGEPVEVKKHFGSFGVDVVAGTSFGIRTDTYKNPDDPFTSLAEKATREINSPYLFFTVFFPNLAGFLRKYLNLGVMFRDSAEFFCDSVKRIIEERRANKDTQRTDLLQLMLNAKDQCEKEDGNQTKKSISEDEILAQGFVAFLAGYRTMTFLLSFVSYVLATHPDVQDKLLEEIDEKVPPNAAEISYDVTSEMPYLDCVINETLRKYPPSAQVQRMTSHNRDVEIDGHWFTGSTQIIFNIWYLHHNPQYYPNPYKFDPDRFTPEEKAKRDPFVYAPFGHGPRNCIGMRLALLEAKIAIISMLRKLKFVKCAETEEPLEVSNNVFVLPKRPIKVGIEER